MAIRRRTTDRPGSQRSQAVHQATPGDPEIIGGDFRGGDTTDSEGVPQHSADKSPGHQPAGRSISPIQLTPAKAARIVRHLRKGADLVMAAQAVGVARSSVYEWLRIAEQGTYSNGVQASPEARTIAARFGRAFARAQAQFAIRQQENIARAAKGRVGDVDWRASDMHLSKAQFTRKVWREQRELRVEQVGKFSIEHRTVATLPTHDLLELAGPDFAELVGPQ